MKGLPLSPLRASQAERLLSQGLHALLRRYRLRLRSGLRALPAVCPSPPRARPRRVLVPCPGWGTVLSLGTEVLTGITSAPKFLPNSGPPSLLCFDYLPLVCFVFKSLR